MTLVGENMNNFFRIKYVMTCFAILLSSSLVVVAADTRVDDVQHGAFILSSEEHKLGTKETSEYMVANGLPSSAMHFYSERSDFGLDEFSNEITRHAAHLTTVFVMFHFHGANDGGCDGCHLSSQCLQGNLCFQGSNFISASEIVGKILVPLEGKKVVLFLQSCFSGHLGEKIMQVLAARNWEKKTPIAIISTDDNKPTSAIYFPRLEYSRSKTQFTHWSDKDIAQKYESMRTFRDYVDFINAWGQHFFFTFRGLHGGEEIELSPFGFKDTHVHPLQAIQKKEDLYGQIKEKLKDIDLSNLVILVAESKICYQNFANDDMWIDAFRYNGVLPQNIHWIKKDKTADVGNPQVHGFFDEFDFISPEQRVMLFVRGIDHVDIDPFFLSEPSLWSIAFGDDRIMGAERIANVLVPKIAHAKRVMVLLCSSHANVGFGQVVSLLSLEQLNNVAVVSFFSPRENFNLAGILAWPMGSVAPHYGKELHFHADSLFYNAFPKCESVYEKGMNSLENFVGITNFESFLEFTRVATQSPFSKDIDIMTHNVDESDLRDFGFLPTSLPHTWFKW